MADAQYWATLAQVIPVFAFALVVEARAETRQWNIETPRWQRGTQALIWIVITVVLAFGELAALRAVRGVVAPPWWPDLMDAAIGAVLGLLILAPALGFFTKGNAESVAPMFGWPLRLRGAILERSLRHWHRKLQAQRQQRWRDIQDYEAVLRQQAGLSAQLRAAAAATNDSGLKKKAQDTLRETDARLQDAAQKIAEFRRGYRQMITFELERNRYLREGRVNRRRLLSEARIEVVRAMLQSGTTELGRPQQTGLLEKVDPDDGGFLPLPEVGRAAEDGDSGVGPE